MTGRFPYRFPPTIVHPISAPFRICPYKEGSGLTSKLVAPHIFIKPKLDYINESTLIRLGSQALFGLNIVSNRGAMFRTLISTPQLRRQCLNVYITQGDESPVHINIIP